MSILVRKRHSEVDLGDNVMKKLFLALLFLFTFCVGGAFAGSPSLMGEWHGEGSAIFPDGYIADLLITADIQVQDGGLVAGSFLFTFALDPSTQFEANFTGYIDKAKNLKGVLSTDGSGTGVADAKWNGKTIEGVAMDLFDMSTTYFSVHKE